MLAVADVGSSGKTDVAQDSRWRAHATLRPRMLVAFISPRRDASICRAAEHMHDGRQIAAVEARTTRHRELPRATHEGFAAPAQSLKSAYGRAKSPVCPVLPSSTSTPAPADSRDETG
jgi:hypothetical protein